MSFLIEKDGEQQFIGHDPAKYVEQGWAIVGEGDEARPDDPEAEWVDGEWLVPLAVLKERKQRAVMDRLAEAFAVGFTPEQGPMKGHTLQVRDQDDKTNWLTSQAAYSSAIAAGAGELPGATFRTAANRTIGCTFEEGHATLLDMAAWGQTLMGCSWRLKDAVVAATTIDELDAIDIEEGWP